MTKHLLSLLLILSITALKAQEWQLINPYPTNNAVLSLSFPSAERGFMSDGYKLFRTDNMGDKWKSLNIPDFVQDVWFTSDNHGWMATADKLYKTTDGGDDWTPVELNIEILIRKMYWHDADTGFLFGGTYASMAKTTDGGNTWHLIDFFSDLFPLLDACIKEVEFIDPFKGFVLVTTYDSSYFFKTLDGGTEWSNVPVPAGIDLIGCFDVLTQNDIWLGEGKQFQNKSDTIATVWHTVNGGNSWSAHDMGPSRMRPFKVNGIKFFNKDQGIAMESGFIYKTSDGGNSWSYFSLRGLPYGYLYDLEMFSFPDEQHLYFGGNGPSLIRSSDGGNNYESLIKGMLEYYTAIHFTDSLNGCIGGYDFLTGRIRYTNDAGKSWHLAETDTVPESLSNFAFPSRNKGWFTSFGHLFGTTDGGKTWKAKKEPFGGGFTAVSAPDTNHVFIKGIIDIAKTMDGGNTWTFISIPGLDHTKDHDGPFQFTDSLTGYITYSDYQTGKLYKTIDGGNSWDIMPAGEMGYVTSMDFSDNLNGIMFDNNYGYRITKDGGYTWNEINHIGGQMFFKQPDTIYTYSSNYNIDYLPDRISFYNYLSVSYDGGFTTKKRKVQGFNPSYNSVGFVINENNAVSVGASGLIQRLIYNPFDTLVIAYPYTGDKIFSPNPSNGHLMILEPGYNTLTVLTLSGIPIYETSIQSKLSVNISHLKRGLYLIRLTGEHGSKTDKLLLLTGN